MQQKGSTVPKVKRLTRNYALSRLCHLLSSAFFIEIFSFLSFALITSLTVVASKLRKLVKTLYDFRYFRKIKSQILSKRLEFHDFSQDFTYLSVNYCLSKNCNNANKAHANGFRCPQ